MDACVCVCACACIGTSIGGKFSPPAQEKMGKLVGQSEIGHMCYYRQSEAALGALEFQLKNSI